MFKRSAVTASIVTMLAMSVGHASPLAPVERKVLPVHFRTLHGLISTRMRSIRPRPAEAGKAVIRFTVQRSGRVRATALYQSSGSEAIDPAAIQALPAVGTRVRPFPRGTTREELTFNVPMRFVP